MPPRFVIFSMGCLAWSALWLAPAKTHASENDADFFEKRIRPILVEHCYECHSGKLRKPKGGLRLDFREGWSKGGASGPAIAPGKPDDSLIIRGVRYWDKDLEMPPDGRLSAPEIADLVEWVKRGAFDPRNEAPPVVASADTKANPSEALIAKGRGHWAFQPLSHATPPSVQNTAWPRTTLDFFTLARMEKAGVQTTRDADRRTLIRRVTFDLTGLPPTPEEVEAFVQDNHPQAFARVVDRLLASPHYGERWGRHWLDVVRYADTCGNASDYPVPQAYKYRNYVIQALNDDVPYDRFVRQQIAGDLLPAKNDAEHFQETIATGYLAIARRFGGGRGPRNLVIDDVIDNLGRTFMGMTLGCARCHDHKFDPVPQSDYYALYGIFNSTTFPHPGGEGLTHPADLVPLLPKVELEAIKHTWQADIVTAQDAVKEMEAAQTKVTSEADGPQKSADLLQAKRHLTEAKAHLKQISDTTPYEEAYAVTDVHGHDAHLQVRGDPERLGEVTPRGFLQILGGQKLPKDCSGSGRIELADWIVDPANPLTARVIVNRVWQHHFGRGLVATPNDFGTRGQAPSHPELLDYLSREFMRSGWSLKALHRLILLSHTWQLSCEATDSSVRNDPTNSLLAHFNRQRLDAESIRDALLFVGGDLDVSEGSAHPFPAVYTWTYTQHKQFFAVYDNHLRSVYQMQQRLRKHPFLALFDGADTNASTGVRDPSITPLQALFMMNDKFLHEQASLCSARLTLEEKEDAPRLDHAFRLLYARPPLPDEARMSLDYLAQMRQRLAARKLSPDEAWPSLVRALLAANEFVYLD